MGNWEADSSNFNYAEWGYNVHTGVNEGKITDGVICTKKGAIAVSLIDGNLKEKVAIHVPYAYDYCVEARLFYKRDIGKAFKVPAKAMAMEIMIHAYPQIVSDILSNKVILTAISVACGKNKSFVRSKLEDLQQFLYDHCKYADIGEDDDLRNFDDFLTMLYNAEDSLSFIADLL